MQKHVVLTKNKEKRITKPSKIKQDGQTRIQKWTGKETGKDKRRIKLRFKRLDFKNEQAA